MSAEKVEGVYHEEKILTGGLRERIRYWAREVEEGVIAVEFLTLNGTSTGMESERLPRADFERRFQKCGEEAKAPAEAPRSAAERDRDKHVRQGEVHMENEEFHSAQYGFQRAVRLDGRHLGAHFGLGRAYLATGENEKAGEVFARMVDNDDLYTEENKHLFNRLGIELRRQSLYEEAVRNYRRALGIDPDDPVLHYNLARSLYHAGRLAEAAESLAKSLALDPELPNARKLQKIMEQENA